jgi:hypothetical protein
MPSPFVTRHHVATRPFHLSLRKVRSTTSVNTFLSLPPLFLFTFFLLTLLPHIRQDVNAPQEHARQDASQCRCRPSYRLCAQISTVTSSPQALQAKQGPLQHRHDKGTREDVSRSVETGFETYTDVKKRHRQCYQLAPSAFAG